MSVSFCINLKQHPEKWNRIQNNLLYYNFKNIERVEAVDGKLLSQDELKQVSMFSKYVINNELRCLHEQLSSLGSIGCYLSHIKCWKEMIKRNIPNAFIFEDDALFIEDKFINFNNCIINLSNTIDIFLFGYSNNRDSLVWNNGLYAKYNLFFGTQGYYITNIGAQKLLKHAFPIEIQVDSYIAIMGQLKNINLLFSKESLMLEDNITGSSIYVPCIKCHISSVETKYICVIIVLIIIIIILLKFSIRNV